MSSNLQIDSDFGPASTPGAACGPHGPSDGRECALCLEEFSESIFMLDMLDGAAK